MAQPITQAPVAAAPPPPPAPPPVAQAVLPRPRDWSAPLPAVSPVEQFELRGLFRISPRTDPALALNSQASGTIDVPNVKPEWDSGQWTFEAVPGSPFVGGSGTSGKKILTRR